MNKIDRTNKRNQKTLCENCAHGIDCMELVPCKKFAPAPSTSFREEPVPAEKFGYFVTAY